MAENHLVYSTETGRIKQQSQAISRPKGDGIVGFKNKLRVVKVKVYR